MDDMIDHWGFSLDDNPRAMTGPLAMSQSLSERRKQRRLLERLNATTQMPPRHGIPEPPAVPSGGPRPEDAIAAVWRYSQAHPQQNAPFDRREREEQPLLEPKSDWAFLQEGWERDATISFSREDGTIETIREIDVAKIARRSFLLALAFEESRSGPYLHLDTLTSATALPFIRFLYTGDYATAPSPQSLSRFSKIPAPSLLLHCQLHRLGAIYDLADLKKHAFLYVLRLCEWGHMSSEKAVDLCAAIRYIYEDPSTSGALVDTILNYCVTFFAQHGLADDAEFRELACELRPFNQDLCKVNLQRDFQNDTAAAIIQMPYQRYNPETYASREDPAAAHVNPLAERQSEQNPHAKERNIGKSRALAALLALQQSKQSSCAEGGNGAGESTQTIAVPAQEQDEEEVEEDWPDPSPPPRPKFFTGLLGLHLHKGEDEGEGELVQKPGEASSTDSDYEIIDKPASSNTLSVGDDSEDEPLPQVRLMDSQNLPQRLAYRRSATASRAAASGEGSVGASSESEWSMV